MSSILSSHKHILSRTACIAISIYSYRYLIVYLAGEDHPDSGDPNDDPDSGPGRNGTDYPDS